MEERGIRMAAGGNPVVKVKRYKENAPEIRFLNIEEIVRQLEVLRKTSVLHAMVATYIYAGLRREEAIWLTEYSERSRPAIPRDRAQLYRLITLTYSEGSRAPVPTEGAHPYRAIPRTHSGG
jgi:hypothetical protein